MTSRYVSMSNKHLKLLELLSTSYCVNLVTIVLTVLNLHWGGGGFRDPPPLSEKVQKPGSDIALRIETASFAVMNAFVLWQHGGWLSKLSKFHHGFCEVLLV